MRNLKKMLLGAVATMAIGAAVAAVPASAVEPTPVAASPVVPSWGNEGVNENTNVPYLAWRGEHVRLGFCTNQALPEASAIIPQANYSAGWTVEDWSGDPANGSIPVPFALPGEGFSQNGCYYATFTSQKSGVAFIKLTLTADGLPAYHHQFIVIWMDLLAPTVTGGGAVDAADFCWDNKIEAQKIISWGGFRVCDPSADPRHRVKVVVKGNVPLKANYSEWGIGDHLTMPDDWKKLADVAARCTAVIYPEQYNGICHDTANAATNWDIHDDTATTLPHISTGGTQCDTDEANVAIDAVDNCRVPSTQAGPFSTVFGTATTPDTWGPYDPMFPAQTLLSDGKVDWGDAPMPAARIDVSIKQNSAASKSDISGVGYLYPSYKTEVYSRDGQGSTWQPWNNGDIVQPVKAHNFYAPFYSQYIPATDRPDIGGKAATGITGAGDADGFNGFLWNGLYDNWDFAWEHSYHPNSDSKCLDQQTYLPFKQWYRPLPYGTSSVSVYTDEHGEANVNYVPSLGMYFDNLFPNKNLNNGCDVEGIDTLGTATLNTIARYPYQPVTAPDQPGNDVQFQVKNLFEKSLAVYSKGVDTNGITSNSVAKIVVAHAQDIDGSPLAYEQICWMADNDAEGMRVFAGDIPAPTASDPDAVMHFDPWHALFTTGKDPWGINRLCTFTNEDGNSAIEVFNSNGTSVNVIAEFVNEGLLRDVFANFATGNTGSVISADGAPVSHIPAPAQLKTVVAVGATGPVVATTKTTAIKTLKSKQAKKATKVVHKLRFAKVVTPFKGKAKLQVRVNGKAGMVKLQVVVKKGAKATVFTRFVPANSTFTVKNLVIPAKTTKVTVRVIGL